jgi:hypothetical protein
MASAKHCQFRRAPIDGSGAPLGLKWRLRRPHGAVHVICLAQRVLRPDVTHPFVLFANLPNRFIEVLVPIRMLQVNVAMGDIWISGSTYFGGFRRVQLSLKCLQARQGARSAVHADNGQGSQLTMPMTGDSTWFKLESSDSLESMICPFTLEASRKPNR